MQLKQVKAKQKIQIKTILNFIALFQLVTTYQNVFRVTFITKYGQKYLRKTSGIIQFDKILLQNEPAILKCVDCYIAQPTLRKSVILFCFFDSVTTIELLHIVVFTTRTYLQIRQTHVKNDCMFLSCHVRVSE